MSGFQLKNCTELEWNGFISGYFHNVFQDPLWGKIVGEGYGADPLFFILQKDNKDVLGAAGNVLDLKIIKLFFSMYPYGEFIGEIGYSNVFLRLLDDELRKKGILRIPQKVLTPFLANGPPFSDLG